MTDFTSLTGPSKPELPAGASLRRPTRAASLSVYVPKTPAPAPARSASSLAAAAHQQLQAITGKRVSRVARLRERLQQAEAEWDTRDLDRGLHAMHDACAAVEFLPARGRPFPLAEFRRQGAAVGAAARRLGTASLHFVGRHAADAAAARLLWIELILESRAMDKRARDGLKWLKELELELEARRESATAEVSQQALQELGRRGRAVEDRLHLVQGLCGAARAARTLGDQVAAHRALLCTTLQEKVRPASLQLQHRLQGMLEAAETRPLEPAELLAAIEVRHDLQVALTRAGAELLQMQSLQQELSTQLGWMEQKARALS